ncbi:MAG: tetratricopeptide repeat protein [Planctomycetota bacterium]|nr:MAG: tetratricopeptide repeat protein [Planctomycetota bacterium]
MLRPGTQLGRLHLDDPYRQAVQRLRGDWTARLRRAQAYARAGDIARAHRMIQTVYRERPDDERVLVRVIETAVEANDFDLAIRVLGDGLDLHDRLLHAAPDPAALERTAYHLKESLCRCARQLLRRTARYAAQETAATVASLLRRMDKMWTLDERTLLVWGNFHFLRHEQERALRLYRRVVESDPGNALGWYNLGFTLERMGRRDEAVRAYRRAVALDPRSQAAQRLAAVGARN